jgi:mRNA interferase HigB
VVKDVKKLFYCLLPYWLLLYIFALEIKENMNIYNKSTLNKYYEKYAETKKELDLWYDTVSKARWTKPADVTTDFNDASAIKNNRIVFNIRNNKYRLIVEFNYKNGFAFIVFIGTHAEYDKVDATTVNNF